MPGPEPLTAAVLRQHRALLSLVLLDKSDFAGSLPRILEEDARALEVNRVSYWRLADQRTRIACELLYELTANLFTSPADLTQAEIPQYFSALQGDRVIRADDARSDPRTRALAGYFDAHGITSMLDIPVWHRGAVVGVLCHEHVGAPRQWNSSEVEFAVSVAGMISIGLDMHARRRAEAGYQLLSTALQDLVWDWDLRTDHIAWHEAAIPLLRFAPGEVEATLEWWKAHLHPDDLERVVASVVHHASDGHGVWREEYRFRRGDGSWAVMMDRGVLERGEDGKPLRMVGAMVDVTEQRRLESRVAVSDRMASVGTLAAGVAHEINNPLTYIHGNLTYALKTSFADGADAQQALREALTGVERVQRIVKDLKAFSRPDEHPSRVELREVIGSALSMAQNEIRHRARLREEHQRVPPVLGNAARLGQVMLNLLINAAQAIPDGRADDHEITVRSRLLLDGRVRVEVEDTGVGISPDLLGRIFDPFFTTKAVGEGSGLGLSISHAIVTSLGGSLTVENNPQGRGAIARVDLLAAPFLAPAAPPEQAARVRPARRGRVLVIDDTLNVCLSMQRLLVEEHDVETTTRAHEALELISRGQRWDVILCDLMMPELSGMELVSEVQKLDASIVPRIVIMSGGAFTKPAQEFLRSWPHGQLEKPIRPETLFDEIRRRMDVA